MCRRFFDPAVYNIILMDQRGCGASTPSACIVDNTTDDLVDDMERLRKHLGFSSWLLFGGSWGVTLALAYSVRHPERCAHLHGSYMSLRTKSTTVACRRPRSPIGTKTCDCATCTLSTMTVM